MISIIGIFHKQHIKKWFPEIWKPLFLLLITSYCLAVYQFRQVPPTAYYFSQLKQGTSLVRLKYHLGCTVDSCIIAKCRDHDRSILAGFKSILSVIFPDTVNKRLSGLGNSSADNNGLRICHSANNGKSTTQLLSDLFHGCYSYRIILLKCVQNCFC